MNRCFFSYLDEHDQESAMDAPQAFDHVVSLSIVQDMSQSSQLQYSVKERVLVDGQDDKVEDQHQQGYFQEYE